MNNEIRSVRLAALAFLSTSAAACGAGGEAEGVTVNVSDSSGIRIVMNSGPGSALSLAAVRVAELTPPDSALTAVPWGVAADPVSGQVYIVDQTSPRVVVFDRNGQYLRTLGRRGQGPGEFMNPNAASIDPYGALTVWDVGRGILSRWSSEGQLLNEQLAPISYWGPAFYERPGELVTVTSVTTGQRMDQQLVGVVGEEVAVIQSVRRQLVTAVFPCGSFPTSPLYEPAVVWSARLDTVHVLAGPEYRIDTFVNRTLIRSLRRDVEPIPVSERLAADRAAWEHRRFLETCDVSAEDFVQAVGFAPFASPIQTITPSPDGRMWVSRTLDGIAPIHVDVFDAEGRYEGTLAAPGVPLAFLSPGHFVAMEVREDTGEMTLSLQELRADSGQVDTTFSEIPLHPGVSSFRDCEACPVMMSLPGGRYLMGSPDGEASAASTPNRPEWKERAEKPQVAVNIAPFALGKYEITFSEWDQCFEGGGCTYRPDGRRRSPDSPVTHIGRDDAQEYVDWLGSITGEAYRLPSEAEWEYAARAGTTTARWWGDELGTGNAVCDGCGSRWDNRSPAPVGSFHPNAFGLHDMLGNVSEWVSDCWHDTHDGAPSDGSPRIETSRWWIDGVCRRPVDRGGAWGFFPWTVRAAHRGYYLEAPDGRWSQRDSSSKGFRVARSLDGESDR